MIADFADQGTEDLFNRVNSPAARRTCPQQLHPIAAKKLEYIDTVIDLNDLRFSPGNRLEALQGSRQGQHSIRINDRYRICFFWNRGQPTAVAITDYHR